MIHRGGECERPIAEKKKSIARPFGPSIKTPLCSVEGRADEGVGQAKLSEAAVGRGKAITMWLRVNVFFSGKKAMARREGGKHKQEHEAKIKKEESKNLQVNCYNRETNRNWGKKGGTLWLGSLEFIKK